ncbi:hypothetical protein L2725_03225 [Shewanella corallii]|uniref:DUF202 domain-containing protein n=2 Tax=Shewanella TaxID=22 RepID=A0ABT0N2Y3_9GAMM|nr:MULTISPECIES: hypothetical protein [Shewanella]MCL1036196.1 hypothetical protein [Shewanella submarina]MCL2912804.1 hypothetical protein [Shewanella corallii]
MRTFTKKYLGGNAINEDSYRIDIIVLEKYQSFSTELLRLALLGIAGYGFLVSNVALKVKDGGMHLFTDGFLGPVFLVLGALAFAISALSALAHRYYSSDCLTHFVRLLRLKESENDLLESIDSEEASLDKDLNRCKRYLIMSCLALVVGAFSVAVSFTVVLINS